MLVAVGHVTEAPNSIMYSRMVPHYSIIIGFLLTYLHGFDITSIDTYNAYLGADTEKIRAEDGWEIWTTFSRPYITNDIETVEGLLLDDITCEVLKSNTRNSFT